MRIIAIIIMLLIGILIILSLPIHSNVKILINLILFAVAMRRITVQVYLLIEKYPTLPVESAED